MRARLKAIADMLLEPWHERQIRLGRRPQRHYREGDIAPDSLLNRPPGSGPIGAMISIDPETNRITKIFHP